MSSADAEAEAARLESSISSELGALRQRGGLSHARVKREVRAIATLPAVDAELARRPGNSRSLAAYNVIRCSVLYAVALPDFKRILVRTLNIDGNGPPTLTERRHTVMAELGKENVNNYLRFEDDAYLELIATLLTLTGSPCDGAGRAVLRDVAALAERALTEHRQELINVSIPAGPIIEILLGWLTNSDSPAEARVLAQELVKQLGLKSQRRKGSGRHLSSRTDPWSALQTRLVDNPIARESLDVLSGTALARLVDPHGGPARSEKDIVGANHPEFLVLGPNDETWIIPEYYRRKARSIKIVARRLATDYGRSLRSQQSIADSGPIFPTTQSSPDDEDPLQSGG